MGYKKLDPLQDINGLVDPSVALGVALFSHDDPAGITERDINPIRKKKGKCSDLVDISP